MHFVAKGKSQGGDYLRCENGRRGVELTREEDGKQVKYKCRAHSVRYDEFEETLLDNLRRLRPESVLPNTTQRAKEAKRLREEIAGIEREQAEIERKTANLMAQIETTDNATLRTRYEKRIEELEAKKPQLEKQKATYEGELRKAEKGAQDFSRWQRGLDKVKEAIKTDIDSRIRLKAHLREFIDKVVVHAKGDERAVEVYDEMMDEFVPPPSRKSRREFLDWVSKRVFSPQGRFYQVFLKNSPTRGQGLPEKARAFMLGGGLRIAPDESLSDSSPRNFVMLCKEFFDGRKPGQFEPKGSLLAA